MMCQKRAMEALEKENISLCEEVMRLKHVLYCYSLQYGTATDQSKEIREIRGEAIKEFSDLFKGKLIDRNLIWLRPSDVVDLFDEVIIEMVEKEYD